MFEFTDEVREQFAHCAQDLMARNILPSVYAAEQFAIVRDSIPADSEMYRRIWKIKYGFYALYGAKKVLEMLHQEAAEQRQ